MIEETLGDEGKDMHLFDYSVDLLEGVDIFEYSTPRTDKEEPPSCPSP